jgi:hypothetical protein
MTEQEQARPEPSDDDQIDAGEERIRALLKRALATEAVVKETPDLLAGVQRRIRRRSRGKFFADGWSTGQARLGYVLVAIVTLLLVVVAYFGMGPMALR